MVSQRLKNHASDIVYLQETKLCIREHLITKADRSLVDYLYECAGNIFRGNVPLTKLQKENLKRNKARLRARTKKSVSLRKNRAILQKGGFLESLLAPIASVVASLLSTLFQ
jgi:exonuclease III